MQDLPNVHPENEVVPTKRLTEVPQGQPLQIAMQYNNTALLDTTGRHRMQGRSPWGKVHSSNVNPEVVLAWAEKMSSCPVAAVNLTDRAPDNA
eukprot:5793865-Pyramimonas_sp.AAC.1